VDFWDIDALADSIYGLINYPGLSKMFISLGKEEVDHMKWDYASSKVLDVYNSVVNN